jgi:hypothetical protein
VLSAQTLLLEDPLPLSESPSAVPSALTALSANSVTPPFCFSSFSLK